MRTSKADIVLDMRMVLNGPQLSSALDAVQVLLGVSGRHVLTTAPDTGFQRLGIWLRAPAGSDSLAARRQALLERPELLATRSEQEFAMMIDLAFTQRTVLANFGLFTNAPGLVRMQVESVSVSARPPKELTTTIVGHLTARPHLQFKLIMTDVFSSGRNAISVTTNEHTQRATGSIRPMDWNASLPPVTMSGEDLLPDAVRAAKNGRCRSPGTLVNDLMPHDVPLSGAVQARLDFERVGVTGSGIVCGGAIAFL